ncbi:MAG: tetratricopeptide repeat protein [Verrucomicrobia bacterium]|nr:tetratricopeptide repeat protein [Verrucomicrobiota bacterium]
MTPSAPPPLSPWPSRLLAAALLAAAFVVHWPALHGTWLWDDRVDLPDNLQLRTLGGLWNIWAHPTVLYDFYPLKHTVQWVQWQLWGEHTLGYHVTNVALHALSALLFWRVLGQLGLRFAWAGGLLFAVHPLTVESVAWIAELKNTLSLPPLLLATSAFIEWMDDARRGTWLRALAWYLVALLCKTSVVMFPCTLLLLLWWKRSSLARATGTGRCESSSVSAAAASDRRDRSPSSALASPIVRRHLLATAPFFALSLVLGLVTVWFQVHRAIAGEVITIGGPTARLALAGTAGGFYFWKSVWPFDLLPIYSRWSVSPFSLWHAFACAAPVATLAVCWWRRATWGRHALLGLGWFALHVAPFVGLITASYMRFSWVMDHFAYVALLGVIGLVVAALECAVPFRAATAGVVALAGLFTWHARAYAHHFRDEHSLWSFTVARDPDAWLAHYNLGVVLDKRGERDAARRHYETTLRLKPTYAEAHGNLGVLLADRGDFAGGLAHLRESVRLDPAYAEGFSNLGFALLNAGHVADAIAALEHAVRVKPDYVDAYANLGSALRRAGRTADAIARFQTILRLRPDSPTVHFNLGNAQRDLGQLAGSIASYERAIALRPALAVAHRNLAISLRDTGRTAEARARYAEARRLDPSFPPWPE